MTTTTARLPAPGWPLWIVFGVGFVPSLIVLLLISGASGDAAESASEQRELLGRTVVVDGVLVDVEATDALPFTQGVYEIVLDDEVFTLNDGQNAGFPPSEEFPRERSFLILVDGSSVEKIDSGPVGSIEQITEQTVAEAASWATTISVLRVVAIVVFVLCAVALPSLAILLGVRRRRAKAALAEAPRTA